MNGHTVTQSTTAGLGYRPFPRNLPREWLASAWRYKQGGSGKGWGWSGTWPGGAKGTTKDATEYTNGAGLGVNNTPSNQADVPSREETSCICGDV